MGGNVRLSCPANAIPPPQITWYKDSQEIREEKGGNIRISDDGHMLEILSAIASDSGQYSCIARNLAGEGERKFDVNVYGQ